MISGDESKRSAWLLLVVMAAGCSPCADQVKPALALRWAVAAEQHVAPAGAPLARWDSICARSEGIYAVARDGDASAFCLRIDPVTGRVLWRKELPEAPTWDFLATTKDDPVILFSWAAAVSERGYPALVALVPDSGTARWLSTAKGGTQCPATAGRTIFLTFAEGQDARGRVLLARMNARTGAALWQHPLPGSVSAVPVGITFANERAVCVDSGTPNGLLVFSSTTGESLGAISHGKTLNLACWQSRIAQVLSDRVRFNRIGKGLTSEGEIALPFRLSDQEGRRFPRCGVLVNEELCLVYGLAGSKRCTAIPVFCCVDLARKKVLWAREGKRACGAAPYVIHATRRQVTFGFSGSKRIATYDLRSGRVLWRLGLTGATEDREVDPEVIPWAVQNVSWLPAAQQTGPFIGLAGKDRKVVRVVASSGGQDLFRASLPELDLDVTRKRRPGQEPPQAIESFCEIFEVDRGVTFTGGTLWQTRRYLFGVAAEARHP